MAHSFRFIQRRRLARPFVVSVAFVMLLLQASMTLSQETGLGSPFIYYPYPLSPKQWEVSAGLVLVTPAKELTEEVWVRAPAFDLHALYGLPSNFALDGRLISQVIQSHMSIGGRWSHPLGNFSVGAGYDIAYWFGFLEVGGFDSKAHGWLNYPSITVGYNTGDVRLLFKTEAILSLYYKSYQGDNVMSIDQNKLVGWSFTTAMEQPFWKNTSLTLGFRATYTKFHWMTWSLASTFDRYLFYPEMIIGFIL
jgi:hypothetical protein